MPSILNSLDNVVQALATQQFGLSISQKNVSNVNNPAYTRQDMIYTGDEEEWARSGVAGVSMKAVRDRYIDYSVSMETQAYSQYSVEANALQQIDAVFNGSGDGLQSALSQFFNSFSALSKAPDSLTLRSDVLTSAAGLAQELKRLYAGIQQVQQSQDSALTDAVADVNKITYQIADLNGKIETAQAARSEDEFTLRDSRQQLIEKLSGLVDLSYYEETSGAVAITTQQGGVLVIGDESRAMELRASGTGPSRSVFLDGSDITGTLKSGTLGGLIEMRDNKIPAYLNTLDDLAATVISRVNAQHAVGSDLDGAAGGAFFTPFTQITTGSNAGAASTMTLAITDPSKIAAAGPATLPTATPLPGDNTNAKLLASIGDEKLFASSTSTAGQFYASLVYRIGSDERTAEDGALTQESLVEQLKNQRDSLSGVNLNEEAVNIIKYQKAYQAIARYANVLDTLSGDLLQLLGA
jgi:flagellar hook-associated protein 1